MPTYRSNKAEILQSVRYGDVIATAKGGEHCLDLLVNGSVVRTRLVPQLERFVQEHCPGLLEGIGLQKHGAKMRGAMPSR
jgi:hypothetical protein